MWTWLLVGEIGERTRGELFPQRVGFFGKDLAGAFYFGGARGEVFFSDLGEVVEIVEEDVLALGGGRIDVAGQREIDKKQRSRWTMLHRSADDLLRGDHLWRGGGADNDVEILQTRGPPFEGEGGGAQTFGELQGSFEAATGNGECLCTAALKSLGSFITDLAGAEQEDARFLEFAENFRRKINSDIGDADLAFCDGGVTANIFRVLECFLEYAVEHGAHAVARLSRSISFLHLAENFGLTEHLRIEAGRNFDEVFDRLAVERLVADRAEVSFGKALEGAKGTLEIGECFGMVGETVKLNTIAGVEHGVFAEAGQLAELLTKSVHLIGCQRELLTEFNWRPVVTGTKNKERRGRQIAHG